MIAALRGILFGLGFELIAAGIAVAVYVLVPLVMRRRGHVPFPYFSMIGFQGGAIAGAVQVHGWWRIPVYVVALAVLAGAWWWKRRKRRGVAALAGAKSRALRDALVRKVRESAKPRPVLKPAPGGAR